MGEVKREKGQDEMERKRVRRMRGMGEMKIYMEGGEVKRAKVGGKGRKNVKECERWGRGLHRGKKVEEKAKERKNNEKDGGEVYIEEKKAKERKNKEEEGGEVKRGKR